MRTRNPTGLLFLTGAAILLTAGCGEPDVGSNLAGPTVSLAKGGEPGPPGGGGGGGGGGGDIPLSITFRDAAADGLSSDGQGAYEDGVAFVSAQINDPTRGSASSHGTLAFRPADTKKNQTPIRLVDVRVTSPDGSQVLFEGSADTRFSTFNDPEGGSPADFTQITDGASQAMVLRVLWDVGSGLQTLRFGRDCDAVLVPQNRVTVTNLSSPPDPWSWRVESAGPAILCGGGLGEEPAHVPFEMVMVER
ncbi:MAG: hypothetical protein R3195_16040 [Gemmatimonadota bacterium]|nr:hypothetical protein [Gemmatimonadota bacterium]